MIRESPFADMKGVNVQANQERDFFVTRKMAERVLDACPNNEWRLIFALSRFGGLRCPSETLLLRWGDVDWERGRMTIRSKKTERYEGKATRVIPVFPDLKPHLEEAFDLAEPGGEYVVARYRDAGTNLRTQLERIIERAGLVPWPKLFQNLRQSRATELAAEFPAHVAADWLGHSTMVAQKHYWRTTDEDFEKALQPKCSALQNPVQSEAAKSRTGRQARSPEAANARSCDLTQCYTNVPVPPVGLEPTTL